ncbi:MAG: pentapeptide repeat-containing protein [Notoacmeibacter sp.]|nr:pentapeptide repeat-containing protein [Notoacmeibacter sp.]
MTNWTTVQIPVPLFHPFTWLGLTAVAILALAWLITHWPYKNQRAWLARLPKLHERPMTNAFVWFAVVLFPFWLGLLVLTLKGTYGLWFNPVQEVADAQGALAYRVHYLALVGLMTALAGLIGAPLAIHRLYTVERQTKATEEGLITDRINKAVEGLGAEKTVERIGRAVTVFYGKPTTMTHSVDVGASFEVPEKSEVVSSAKQQPWVNPRTDDVEINDEYEVRTWPNVRTEIEWRDEKLKLEQTDKVSAEGDWQVFKQTVPNLEVRIGAIYALERIAQDSLRDHIQIMEILCAYIRENAEASDIRDALPEAPDWFAGENADGRAWKGPEPFFEGDGSEGVFDIWRDDIRKRLAGIKPRADIQTALTVIGRRSRKQKELEWASTDPSQPDWRPFTEAVPAWPEWSAKEDGTASDEYKKAIEAHRTALRGWRALKPTFRLDLRGTDMRGADMSGSAQQSDFSLARFDGAVVQGANFQQAQAQGANFSWAKAQGANFTRAQAQGAIFFRAQAQGANFTRAQAQDANFSEAQAQDAHFMSAQAQGANFREAQFSAETTFSDAEFLSASLKSCDLTGVPIGQDQVNASFGDASTKLPKDIEHPSHWPDWDMPEWSDYDADEMTFYKQWQKWQADKAGYVPPRKPEEA